jgi:hypothetical protein
MGTRMKDNNLGTVAQEVGVSFPQCRSDHEVTLAKTLMKKIKNNKIVIIV